MFKEIFNAQQNNVHMYLDKIFQLHNQMTRIITALQSIDSSLFKKQYQSRNVGFPVMTETDQLLMFATRDIKNTIDAEIKTKTKSQASTLDNVSIMLYSLKKNDLDFKLVQKINDFYQGTDKQTFVSHLISSVADLTRIFSDIDTIAEPVNYPVYFRSKLSGNEGLFKLLDIDLESHIKDMLFDDANCEIRL
jgi:hypothetical protein